MLRYCQLLCVAVVVLLTTCETGLAQFRLRLPFISVDNYNGNTAVDVFPFVSVRRGYGGVAVDAPFTRVRRPRFYGPYDAVPFEPQPYYGAAPQPGYADPLTGQPSPLAPQPGAPYANARPAIRVELQPGVQVLEPTDDVTAELGPPSPVPEAPTPDVTSEPDSKILKNGRESIEDETPSDDTAIEPSSTSEDGGLRIPGSETRDEGPVIYPAPVDQAGIDSRPPIQPVPDYSIPALPSAQRRPPGANSIRQASGTDQGDAPTFRAAASQSREAASVRHTLVIPVAPGAPNPAVRTVIDPTGRSAGQQTASTWYLTPIPHTEIANHFTPAEGLHIFALIHPLTGQPYGIKLRLPAGEPVIDVQPDGVVFDYGQRKIGLVFARDGSVLMDYGN